MNKNVELLAPAGTYEAFLAAVENGANAVYLGGKLFNARANASNFDIDELKKIVEYAHLRDVKVHLTMNTLLDDSEIKEALKFAYSIYEIGIDAVIVQDLGLAKVLHEYIPNLVLHASTQLSTHTLEGVQELAKLGFSRVVLARELSIEEIKYICNNTDTEIEIFSHGALCVSYSGQCLMSSMIGDRSGNRGKCAQPCRLPYKLVKNDKEIASGYLLSPKDLSTLEILQKLPNVACLKIEGRMKSPEYVATVVSTYRKYLDNLNSAQDTVSQEDKNNLAQVFNRGGFSKAYLYSKTGKDMMCYEKPKNWGLYIGKVTNYDGKRYITIDDVSNINIGDGIEIWNGTNESPSTIVSEIIGNKIGRIHGKINIGDKVYKTSDKALNQKARESFSRGFVRRSPVSLKIFIQKEQPIKLVINDFEFSSTIIPDAAQKQPLTEDKISSQFSKTGNTPFEVTSIEIQLDNELFLPVSTLNELRRQAFEAYENMLLSKIPKHIEKQDLKEIKSSKSLESINTFVKNKNVSVFFNILSEEYLTLEDVESFYFTFKDSLTKIELIEKFNGKKYIVFPAITKANYDKLIKKNLSKLISKVDGFVLSNIGQLEYFENYFKEHCNNANTTRSTELIANYNFNTFNSYSLKLLEELGFNKVILSPELAKFQINSLPNLNIEKEIIAYGNICSMTSEYCPIGSLVGGLSTCSKCSMPCTKNDKYYLRDRLNMDFRILPDNIDCQSRIFNAKINSIETNNLNVDSIRIDIIDEQVKEIQNIINIHKKGKKLSGEQYTNGHLNRPV
ncbi:MAG: U32 family peptidase [Clostridia bacterium]|nr:U32 family peptidase [Clostridia bacterium]